MRMAESRRKRQILLFAAAFAAAFPVGAQEPETASGEVIASLRGSAVTAGDWRRTRDTGQIAGQTRLSTPEAENFVRGELRAQLLAAYQRDAVEREQIAETPVGRWRAWAAVNDALANHARTRGLAGTLEVPDEAVRDYYQEHIDEFDRPDQLSVRHIYLSTQGLSEASLEAVRTLAGEIVTALEASPARFAELAREHSQSENTNPDAILGPISPDQIHEELREPLWALGDDEVGGPFESRFGLHIFMVDTRYPVSVPFDQASPMIIGRLRQQAAEERTAELVENAEEEFGLTLHPAPETLEADTPVISGAIEVDGQALALAFDLDLESAPEGDQLAELVRQTQENAVLAAEARRQGWDSDPTLRQSVEQAEAEALRTALWLTRVEASSEITDEDVRRQYDENPGAYRDPVRVLARILELRPVAEAEPGTRVATLEVLNQAQALRARWASGEAFEDLVREASTAADADEGGVPRWIYPYGADSGQYSAAANLATGEVSEPIRLTDGYALIEALQVENNHLQPFEEVEDRIRTSLLRSTRRSIYRAWNASLEAEAVLEPPVDIVAFHTRDYIAPEPETASPEAP